MTGKAIELMTSDVNVGIDEVVSVFVSQYEDNLFAKKKELSAEIKRVKKEITALDKRLIADVDRSEYDITVPVLNLKSKVEDVSIIWKGEEDEDDYSSRKVKVSSIVISIEIEDKDKDSDGWRNSITKRVKSKISKTDENLHTALLKEQSSLSSELTEVLGLIKSVSRKERQVRGRISAKKLEASGYEGLLNDSEMLALVQLD
jgi:hypothetical protein